MCPIENDSCIVFSIIQKKVIPLQSKSYINNKV